MTTQVKIELTQIPSYPVEVFLKTGDTKTPAGILHNKGDNVLVYVHQNQDVIFGEIKADKA